MITIEQLKSFYTFADLPRADLLEIARCGEVRDFNAGDTIFEEGASAVSLYGVLEGEVELSILLDSNPENA